MNKTSGIFFAMQSIFKLKKIDENEFNGPRQLWIIKRYSLRQKNIINMESPCWDKIIDKDQFNGPDPLEIIDRNGPCQ